MRKILLLILLILSAAPVYSQTDGLVEYDSLSYSIDEQKVEDDGRTAYIYVFTMDAQFEKSKGYNKAAILFQLVRDDREYFTEDNSVLVLGGADLEYLLVEGESFYVENLIDEVKRSPSYRKGSEFMVGGVFDLVKTDKYYVAVKDYKYFKPLLKNTTIAYYND